MWQATAEERREAEYACRQQNSGAVKFDSSSSMMIIDCPETFRWERHKAIRGFRLE
jgi:hypothetical protein